MGNRLCTLGFLGLHCTPFPYKSFMLKRLQLIPRIQWVACRTVPVTGAGAGHGGRYTIPVATRWHVLPIPVHVGDRRAPGIYRSRCNQGQKGSVMHRFRGYRGKLDAKKYQVPPRFPGLRGCTRPIANSWGQIFFRGVRGREYPSGHVAPTDVRRCRLSSKIDTRPFHGRDILLVCFSLVWSVTHSLYVKQNRHAAVPRPAREARGHSTGTYRPRRRAYPSGGQL